MATFVAILEKIVPKEKKSWVIFQGLLINYRYITDETGETP
jgi:hypothetical protein